MKIHNVFIISDDKQTAEAAASKILLSRKNDSVYIEKYANALSACAKQHPDIIFLYVENEQQVELIKKIKNEESLKNCFIIMSAKNSDNEILCKAFDAGVDDIIDINDSETVFSMRIFWALKNKVSREAAAKRAEILSSQKITDKDTGFYLENYTRQIFSKEYQKYITNYQKAVFMMITADKHCRSLFSVFDAGKIIKSVIRTNDMVGYTQDNKIYLFLRKIDEKGAKIFYEKINNLLPFDISVSAAVLNISSCEKFSEAERILNKNLEKALENGNTFVFAGDFKPINPLFDKINPTFSESLIKEMKKSIEKIATPVFFKMQSIYEPKLYDTDISQNFGDKECSFVIKNRDRKTVIAIKYSDSEEIKIELKETCKQNTDYDTKTILKSEFTGEMLENIIQYCAEKFRKSLYKRED